MKKKDFMLGVAVDLGGISDEETVLMREAGVGWLRCGHFGFNAEAFLRGDAQGEEFDSIREKIVALREKGFQIMGITPHPRDLADSIGTPGSPDYFENYGKVCAFLGSNFEGLIDTWQIGNELDIWIFRAELSLEQSVEFLKAGVRAMKAAVPGLKTGINITLFPSLPGEVDGNTERHEGVFLAEQIYGDTSLDLDYAGFDSYPGTWREGGAESWDRYLEDFHRLTGKPIIIQEFGYSSAGGMMNEEEIKSGVYPCKAKKWKFSWKGAHTPEIQSDFIRESFKRFAEKPFVIGATYYSWRDSKRCWQCGDPDCPAETAWGLLNRQCHPKVSYYGFKEAAALYFGAKASQLESIH